MIFGGRKADDETVVTMLASAIRRDISFGVLSPDQKLKLVALRQSYGGSNHSMRETLRMLTAEGLVEATNQRGFRVTSATESDLRDILLMRVETEKLALKRSLKRGDVAWEASVVAAFHALGRTEAVVAETPDDITALAWDEACRDLTLALVSASGSPRLTITVGKFYNQSRRFRLAMLREGRIDFATRHERQTVLQAAIIARDTPQVLTLWEEEIHADLGA